MGRLDVHDTQDPHAIRVFTRAVLRDLHALEKMLAEGMIESGVRRFGAEQELFLVDGAMRPACVAEDVLARLEGHEFTTELAKFNLEFNLDPQLLEGACFSGLHAEIDRLLGDVRKAASEVGASVVLAGILPTLRKTDLSLENITPRPRYYALNDAMNRMRGGNYRLRIIGTDDLNIEHDSVMLEACNTSAQFHLQVDADEFAHIYNVSQAMVGPVLAACVNSPLLFGRRLWAETRIALFQQSLDTRSTSVQMRELRPRVRFGDRWVRSSVTDLFEEDIAHFRALIATETPEDPFEVLASGGVPSLQALQLHNGTVYRWNRPCYGVGGGKPHLRIECRAIPSGPSVIDEVANAALWMGAVMGAAEEYQDITERLNFDMAKSNFVAAARMGLSAGFNWLDGTTLDATTLLTQQIIPLAEAGLRAMRIDEGDIERYLGLVRRRVDRNVTGSSWALHSLAAMAHHGKVAERMTAVTAATLARQERGTPVDEWELAHLEEGGGWTPTFKTVEQYMTTTLFTVQEDELIDLVAFLMDKNTIRHVLVENADHELVGIVSYRSLLRMIARGENPNADPLPVSQVMHRDPVTVTPDTTTLDAIDQMRENHVSCLPVVSQGKLVGIVSESDFMPIAYHLLTRTTGFER